MTGASEQDIPRVEVVIEIPKGGFVKRGHGDGVDFVSPFPCPFNYGAVHSHIGGDGDFLDAVVLGPRLARGARVTVAAFGAVGLHERYLYDDKLVCAARAPRRWQVLGVLAFFHLYALAKGMLNLVRRRPGAAWCAGWGDARKAIARAHPHEGARDTLRAPF